MKTICIFCGSSSGIGEAYLAAARNLGATLAQRGIGIVYGGAHVGTMGAVADAALAAGGSVTGIMPQRLVDREVAHKSLTRFEVVDTMHQRKARMAELSDAFIALPGGFGTLDELFEILTWAQIGLHQRPIALLDVDGFFQPLVTYLHHANKQGFIADRHLAMLQVHTDVELLLNALSEAQGVAVPGKFTVPTDA